MPRRGTAFQIIFIARRIELTSVICSQGQHFRWDLSEWLDAGKPGIRYFPVSHPSNVCISDDTVTCERACLQRSNL